MHFTAHINQMRYLTFLLTAATATLLCSCSKEPQTTGSGNSPAAARQTAEADLDAAFRKLDTAMGGKPEPAPKPSFSPDAMLLALKREYARQQLPAFLIVREAPFEIIDATTAPSYRVKGKVVLEAVEDTFVGAASITNDLNKNIIIAKPVLTRGGTIEVPFTMDVVSSASGIQLSAPPTGRNASDLGVPLSHLVNAIDGTTETGQRVAAAGPRLKALKDEIYRVKHSPRKLALDGVRDLLENNQDSRLILNPSPTRALYPELGSVADEHCARASNRGGGTEYDRQGRLFRREIEKRFAKDYADFYAALRQKEQELADLQNFLNSL